MTLAGRSEDDLCKGRRRTRGKKAKIICDLCQADCQCPKRRTYFSTGIQVLSGFEHILCSPEVYPCNLVHIPDCKLRKSRMSIEACPHRCPPEVKLFQV